jgi:hypothetical protein
MFVNTQNLYYFVGWVERSVTQPFKNLAFTTLKMLRNVLPTASSLFQLTSYLTLTSNKITRHRLSGFSKNSGSPTGIRHS